MNSLTRLALICAVIGAAACGGDDDDMPDARPTPDARADGGTTPDAILGACQAAADYGTLTPAPADQLAVHPYDDMAMMNDPDTIIARIAADGSTPQDVLSLQLYKGFTTYTGAPGSFPLTGPELDFATCGVCVRIFANVDQAGVIGSQYMATAGTVVITDVTPTMLTGELQNVTFQHVTGCVDTSTPPYHCTPANDGCDSMLTSVPFSMPITEEPAP